MKVEAFCANHQPQKETDCLPEFAKCTFGLLAAHLHHQILLFSTSLIWLLDRDSSESEHQFLSFGECAVASTFAMQACCRQQGMRELLISP